MITVRHLTLRYGSQIVQQNLSFTVHQNEVFVIMGGSGCGKSTLLRHLIGLNIPAEGEIFYENQRFDLHNEQTTQAIQRRFGVLFQSGALFSAMTLLENVMLPLQIHRRLKHAERVEVAREKLSLVGLDAFANYYPNEISGGMQKRAGLARAIALNPEMLFFDEPSAGLDPLSAKRLDDLILDLKSRFNSTIIMVTHELASIFAVADRALFLDADEKTATALGAPTKLRDEGPLAVRRFLRRGELA